MKMLVVLCVLGFYLITTAGFATDDMRARGLIKSSERAIFAGEITARIIALPKRTGDMFQTGDVLVEFDCRAFKAQMQKVEAETNAAKTQLANAKQLEKLRSVGKLDVALAEANYQKTSAELELAQLNAERCKIIAPFSGRVVQQFVRAHETASPQQHLIEVAGTENMEVEVIVPSTWLARLKTGSQHAMSIDETGAQVTVELVAISGAVDPVSQTLVLRARIISTHEGLLPGMSGEITF